jgi:cell fate regulator YaaT (PSP1 superfamily)
MPMDPRPDDAVVLVTLSCSGRPQPCLVARSLVQKPLRAGTSVVVETETGLSFGRVEGFRQGSGGQPEARPAGGARVLRVAAEDDCAVRRRQQGREREAFRVGLLKIRERGLAMKLTRVEQLYDGSRLVFYFTAEGRVDFRDLVRELAAEFRTRIEMRQIGVRDEARMIGGYGSCGRPLCCSTWLQSFEPVSIKMAKQQDLSLNPSKLSGLCGRLKCCLRYELADGKGHRKADLRAAVLDEDVPLR